MGSRGYFGKRGSVTERVQSRKVDPFAESTERTWTHVSQRPPAFKSIRSFVPLGFGLFDSSGIEIAWAKTNEPAGAKDSK
jgi:hypothetical protein